MEYRFNWEAVTIVTLGKAMQVEGVDRHTITYEAIDEINKVFGTDKMTDAEDVRAVRNSVVKLISHTIDTTCMDKDGEWLPFKEAGERMMDLQMWMSAITGALDHRMFILDPKSV